MEQKIDGSFNLYIATIEGSWTRVYRGRKERITTVRKNTPVILDDSLNVSMNHNKKIVRQIFGDKIYRDREKYSFQFKVIEAKFSSKLMWRL